MNATNTNITWQAKPLTIRGKALKVGDAAPNFRLVNAQLEDVTLKDFAGESIVLSVVPSLDTSTCDAQTKRFNSEAYKSLEGIKIITVSLDLPFAQSRWCENAKCEQVTTLSDYKYRTFGEQYGVYIEELGLLTRAIFVIDQNGTLRHVEYTKNISDEPNYEEAILAVNLISPLAANG